MHRRSDNQVRCGRLSRIAVALALLVLASGMSRLFVVCLGHHGEPRLETAHAGGCCDQHEHSSSEHPDCDHGGCLDRSTLIAVPPPQPEDVVVAAAAKAPVLLPPVWPCAMPLAPGVALAQARLRPPRWPQRLLLRRSIVLLV